MVSSVSTPTSKTAAKTAAHSPAGVKVIDFLGKRKLAVGFSAFLTIGAILLLLLRGLNFGIDFAGGVLVEAVLPTKPDLAPLRDKLNQLQMGGVELQELGDANTLLIRMQLPKDMEAAQGYVLNQVKGVLGDGVTYRRVETVGPKVGEELIGSAIWALVLSMLGIGVYVWARFEWQFGATALFATLHDVLTTVGLLALLGREFNLVEVAALLTLAGYSINDTIVVFDRLRENMRKYKTMPMRQLMNLSVTETLSRTIMTASTVMLASLAMVFFGSEVTVTFCLAMIWGVLIGTYSSIYVASAVLLYLPALRPAEARVQA
ncbi:MAG: protein translocase subunit SecF [Alphaproteobacteria bacterium]|nr:protein translocase subunit SecF [Alphaproteobacteria bacterium]